MEDLISCRVISGSSSIDTRVTVKGMKVRDEGDVAERDWRKGGNSGKGDGRGLLGQGRATWSWAGGVSRDHMALKAHCVGSVTNIFY